MMNQLATLLVLAFATPVFAVLVPPDVLPGETYQLAFVTVHGTQPSEGGIGFYNDFVNVEAALSLTLTSGVEWFAIASTRFVNARDNALVTAPVYRLDGVKVADGFDDMWDDTLDAPILLDQFAFPAAPLVWTGTYDDGTSMPNGYLGGGGTITGSTIEWISPNWISHIGFGGTVPDYPLYALSEPLTAAAIPEPSPVLVFCGLAAWAVMTERRKR